MTYFEIITYINTWINPIAILITIILFVIFILGKMITSTRGSWDSTEDLLFNPSEEVIDELPRVYLYEDDYVEGTILLRSDETLYDVTLHSVEVTKKEVGLSKKGKILTVPDQGINCTKIKKLKPSEGVFWSKFHFLVEFLSMHLRGINTII
ncbi:MAG: hypothetical protein ACYDEJ_12050 [Desulfitobacteriaceae bacterium]